MHVFSSKRNKNNDPIQFYHFPERQKGDIDG
jgi:hypothetical protein